jgi:superfamily II DNA or RNA helicase
MKTSRSLLQHQQRVLDHVVQTGRGLLLYWSTGVGKSVGSIAIMNVLLRSSDYNVVVTTTSSTIRQWQNEIALFRDKFDHGLPHRRITIMTHNAFHSSKHRQDMSNQILFIDEAHVYRYTDMNNLGKTKLRALEQCRDARLVFLLTATPVWNDPSEAATLYAMLHRVVPSKKELTAIGKMFQQNRTNCWRCLVSIYERDQDDENYPSTNVYQNKIPVITVPFSDDEQADYNRAEANQNLSAKDLKNPNAFLTSVRQWANTSSKVAAMLDTISRHLKTTPKGKIVVYSGYLELGLSKFETDLKKEWNDELRSKLSWGKIESSMNADKRQAQIDSFNARRNNMLLISDSGATGIDLKEVTLLLVMEPQWNRETVAQATGRAVRKGSFANQDYRGHVNIFVYCSVKNHTSYQTQAQIRPTADERLLQIMKEKEEKLQIFQQILRNESIESLPCEQLPVGECIANSRKNYITNVRHFEPTVKQSSIRSPDFDHTPVIPPSEVSRPSSKRRSSKFRKYLKRRKANTTSSSEASSTYLHAESSEDETESSEEETDSEEENIEPFEEDVEYFEFEEDVESLDDEMEPSASTVASAPAVPDPISDYLSHLAQYPSNLEENNDGYYTSDESDNEVEVIDIFSSEHDTDSDVSDKVNAVHSANNKYPRGTIIYISDSE